MTTWPKTYTPDAAPPEVLALAELLVPRLLAGDGPALATLRDQYDLARITRVELTGVGCYVHFAVPDEVARVEPPDFQGGDARIEATGLAHGAGCLVFIEGGRLALLEVFTYDEPWQLDTRVTALDDVVALAPPTSANEVGPGSRSKRGLWILAALAVFGLVAARYLPLEAWIDTLTDWGQRSGPLGALAVGLLFVPICIFMLPASALTYAMAFAFGLWPAVLGVVTGAVLGASAVFLLGRYLARDVVERGTRRYPLLAALDEVLDERSFGLIVLVRLSPLFPFALVGYALGATRIGFWRHAAATGLAIIPQVTLTCYIGASVGDVARGVVGSSERSPLEYGLMVVGILAAIGVLAVISSRARKALLARTGAAAEPGSEGTEARDEPS